MADVQDSSFVVRVRANVSYRLLAKAIDFLVAGALWKILPSPIGIFSAIAYILLADGFPPHGQSLGKRLIGLRVIKNIKSSNPLPCAWENSIIRNLPFVISMFAISISFIGILLLIIGCILVAFETYFVVTDHQGVRLGDIFANTKVLDVEKK